MPDRYMRGDRVQVEIGDAVDPFAGVWSGREGTVVTSVGTDTKVTWADAKETMLVPTRLLKPVGPMRVCGSCMGEVHVAAGCCTGKTMELVRRDAGPLIIIRGRAIAHDLTPEIAALVRSRRELPRFAVHWIECSAAPKYLGRRVRD